MSLHIIKLVVGIDELEPFARWQEKNFMLHKGQKVNVTYTRYKPKRAAEIIDSSGSIYRVIKGRILCRQKIISFEIEEDNKRGKHCLILTDTEIIRTCPRPHRPFQGWRYMEEKRIAEDVGSYVLKEQQPLSFEEELKEFGFYEINDSK